jgi:hypothetical protein
MHTSIFDRPSVGPAVAELQQVAIASDSHVTEPFAMGFNKKRNSSPLFPTPPWFQCNRQRIVHAAGKQ